MNFLSTALPPPRSLVAYRHLCGVEFPYPAIKRGWLHGRQLKLAWDLERIHGRMGAGVWLSHYEAESGAADPSRQRLSVLAGFWPAGGFVEVLPHSDATLDDHPRQVLAAYAATPARCTAIFQELLEGYVHRDEVAAAGPRIGILNSAYDNLEVQRIALTPEQIVARADVDAFYGATMPAWLDHWLTLLAERRYGLTLFSGPPGTGKTTLLRSLAFWLNATHMFYFMPAARFLSVESGEIVKFWADQNRHSKLRKVLILEDAQSVLQRRAADNREKVATILNLTDGMMGDALGLQVICTMNGDLTDLDPALLRPGRLIGHRELGPLSLQEARRLATRLGRPLPGAPATLAEILRGPSVPAPTPPLRRVLGFHANLLHS